MAFSTLPYRSHVPWVCGSYSSVLNMAEKTWTLWTQRPIFCALKTHSQ